MRDGMTEDFHSESAITSDGQAALMVGGITYAVPISLALRMVEIAELVAQAEATS